MIFFANAGCKSPNEVGDGFCDDYNNNHKCEYDGGDCCDNDANHKYCTNCQCLDPNHIGYGGGNIRN